MKKFHLNDPILRFLPNHNIPRKVVIFPIAAFILIGLIGLISLFFHPNQVYNGGTDYILYVKNKDLYLTDHQSQPAMIASNIFRPWVHNSEIYTDVDTLSDYIVISDNRDRIFFPIKYNEFTCTLAYRDLYTPKKGNRVIDRNLYNYVVSADGNSLIGEDFQDNLQRYTLPGRQFIATNIVSFETDAQADTIYWTANANLLNLNSPSTLYMQQSGSEAQVLARGNVHLQAYSQDTQTIYFNQDHTLYKKAADGQPERISDDFYEINGLWETGELYFSSYSKLVGYSSIYYYDGEHTTELFKKCIQDCDFAQTQPVGIIHATPSGKDVWYFVSDGQLQLLEDPQIQDAVISPYGNMLAYTTDDSNGNTSLYTVEIRENQLGQPVKLDVDISLDTVTFMENSRLRYFAERISDAGDLYIDGKLIDSNVLLYKYKCKPSDYWVYPPFPQTTVEYCVKTGATIYYTDFDSQQETGTLKLYNGEASVVIDENVTNFQITESGDVFYLLNYDFSRYTGQLWVYRNGERHLVDNGVTDLISFQDN